MKKVFLDTNVVLDIALAHPVLCDEASEENLIVFNTKK